MKKLLMVLSAVTFAGALFAQQITNVRLSPAKSSYNAGEQVTIKWDYTGLSIPSTAPVKITLWRQGSSQSICKIAENISIGTGASGYQWTVPSTCTNPHTGATEDLTRGNLKIRVRWQGHPVWGESSGFQIKMSYSFTNIPSPGDLKPDLSTALKKAPKIYNAKFLAKDRNQGLYSITWDYKNLSPDARIKAELIKGHSIYCTVRINVPVSAKSLDVQAGNFCNDGKPQPKPGDKYKIQLSLMEAPRAVFAHTPPFMIPGQPDLVTCITFPYSMILTLVKAKVCVEVKLKGSHIPRPLSPFKVKFHIDENGTKTYTFNTSTTHKCRDIYFWKPVTDPNGAKRKIWAEVDTTNVIRESNENNNRAEGFIVVYPSFTENTVYYKICSDGTRYVRLKGSHTWKPWK